MTIRRCSFAQAQLAYDNQSDPRCEEPDLIAYDGEPSCRQCKHDNNGHGSNEGCCGCHVPKEFGNFEPAYDPDGLWEESDE